MPDVTPLTLPADEDLVPIMPPDWTGAVRVGTSWMTDISRSATTLTEERRSVRARPVRTVEADVLGPVRDMAFRLRAYLRRRGRARNPVPLWCDAAETTGTASGTNIPCVTSHRRFFTGQRILIYQPWGENVYRTGSDEDQAEYAEIASLTSSAITLTGGTTLSFTYPAGSRVVPLIDAEIPVAQGDDGGGTEFRLITDEVAAATLAAEEVLGPSSLPGEATGNPSGFPTSGGYPVLDTPPDWSSEQLALVLRDGSVEDTGLTSHVWGQAEEPRHGFTLSFSSLGRERAYDLRRFFDSRRGRCLPFWLPSPQTHFRVEDVPGTTHVMVTLDRYFDFESVSKMAFVLRDGTVSVYTLDSHTILGSPPQRRLTFTATVSGFTAADVLQLVPLHFVRFASDTLEEEWDSTEAGRVTVSVIEIQAEAEVEVTDI